jgi:16S rRNA (guanine527-N7)-methyltransferase
MTEEEARAWLAAWGVSRETSAALERFVDLLLAETARQNLISAASQAQIWARHIVDSAQLLDLASTGSWVDLGSGAGFPGLIIAAVGGRPVTLVETRAKRVQFLHEAAAILDIGNRVTIVQSRVETMPAMPFDVICARAFAPLPRLLEVSNHLATPATQWLLPKGRSAAAELAALGGSWQGDFQIVPSITDPESAVIVASSVRPGKQRR